MSLALQWLATPFRAAVLASIFVLAALPLNTPTPTGLLVAGVISLNLLLGSLTTRKRLPITSTIALVGTVFLLIIAPPINQNGLAIVLLAGLAAFAGGYAFGPSAKEGSAQKETKTKNASSKK